MNEDHVEIEGIFSDDIIENFVAQFISIHARIDTVMRDQRISNNTFDERETTLRRHQNTIVHYFNNRMNALEQHQTRSDYQNYALQEVIIEVHQRIASPASPNCCIIL